MNDGLTGRGNSCVPDIRIGKSRSASVFLRHASNNSPEKRGTPPEQSEQNSLIERMSNTVDDSS